MSSFMIMLADRPPSSLMPPIGSQRRVSMSSTPNAERRTIVNTALDVLDLGPVVPVVVPDDAAHPVPRFVWGQIEAFGA